MSSIIERKRSEWVLRITRLHLIVCALRYCQSEVCFEVLGTKDSTGLLQPYWMMFGWIASYSAVAQVQHTMKGSLAKAVVGMFKLSRPKYTAGSDRLFTSSRQYSAARLLTSLADLPPGKKSSA